MGKVKKFRKELEAGFGGLFDDPCLELFSDTEKKKKKKAKDKKSKKDKAAGMSKRDRTAEEAYIESLKVLDKKELRKKLERFGGTVRDGMSRKDMIKEIARLRRRAIDRDNASISVKDPTKSMGSAALVAMEVEEVDRANDGYIHVTPPFYFDEKSRSFVIHEADTAPDTTVYSAMRGLGAIRRNLRPDDGFGELMERIHQSITSPGYDPKALDKPIIDVEFKVIDEEPVRKELPMAGLVDNLPVEKPAPPVVELSDDDLGKLSANIDSALNALNSSAEASKEVDAKIEGKKKSRKK